MDRCHHSPDDFNPADCLMFTVEERWECGSSGKVRYVTRTEDYLPLPIELGDSVNKEAVAEFDRAKKEKEEKGERVDEKDKVRAVIPLESCLARLCQEEQVCKLSRFGCQILFLATIGNINCSNKYFK